MRRARTSEANGRRPTKLVESAPLASRRSLAKRPVSKRPVSKRPVSKRPASKRPVARLQLARLPSATLRTATLLLAVLLATALAGCDRAPACAPGACPSGTVCELDGTCRPLADRDALRFTRALRLAPTAWGATRRDRRSEVARDLDEWALGGGVDGTVHLRFPLPEEGEIMAAVLALWPAPGARPEGRRRVVVARTAPFDPATLQRRLPARRVGRARVARELTASVARPLRFDVTALVREAREEGAEAVHLALEAGGDGDPWRVASPLGRVPRRRPRLDLRLR